MTKPPLPKKPKGKVLKLSAEERQKIAVKREHIRQIRFVFKNAGFTHINTMEGKVFEFENSKCDFDDIFILDNILVLAEYTAHNESHVAAHLFKKKILFDKISAQQEKFIKFLKSEFPEMGEYMSSTYDDNHFQVKVIYCSRYLLKPETKENVPSVKFLDYAHLKYFFSVVNIVKKSSRFEILDFLGVEPKDYKDMALNPGSISSQTYSGSILPESNSHFQPGFKVVSFYVDAQALLERAYVLRKDGWRTTNNIYQRMIEKNKVEAIRRHLLDKKGVFINNIIVTLPPDTKILNSLRDTLPLSEIKLKPQQIEIQLTNSFNSVGIIDGQHRVFSYHERGSREEEVANLRRRQNLLVTGVIFPENITKLAQAQFEARLFLEINSNQSNASTELKQEIGIILKPFANESIARNILKRMNETNGPLSNEFEKHFWDKDKIKTTTIVSYGIVPLIRIPGEENLYSRWDDTSKSKLIDQSDENTLLEYIKYCSQQINTFISAFKKEIPKSRWTADRKIHNRVLTTTIINGLIACLRQLAKHDQLSDFESYRLSFKDIEQFDFRGYKSSHYNNLGKDLAKKFFNVADKDAEQIN